MGFLDLLPGSGSRVPKYQAPEMDEVTQDALNRSMGRAQRSQGEFQSDLTQGTEQGQQAMQTPDQQSQHVSALGSGNQAALYQALSNKTNRMISSDNANLNRKASTQAVQNKWNAMSPAASFTHQMAGIEEHNNQMEMQYQIMKQRARSGALSGLLGAVGMGGGMALANATSKKQAPPQTNTVDAGEAEGYE